MVSKRLWDTIIPENSATRSQVMSLMPRARSFSSTRLPELVGLPAPNRRSIVQGPVLPHNGYLPQPGRSGRKFPHLQGAQLGDLILEDYNKDGKITADDQVRSDYGNVPLLTYGLVFNGGYQAFDLSVVFSGQGMVSQYVSSGIGSDRKLLQQLGRQSLEPYQPGRQLSES
jgi:hypothetical protein